MGLQNKIKLQHLNAQIFEFVGIPVYSLNIEETLKPHVNKLEHIMFLESLSLSVTLIVNVHSCEVGESTIIPDY